MHTICSDSSVILSHPSNVCYWELIQDMHETISCITLMAHIIRCLTFISRQIKITYPVTKSRFKGATSRFLILTSPPWNPCSFMNYYYLFDAFFYLSKLQFSGFLHLKGNFVNGQNNTKCRDWASLNKKNQIWALIGQYLIYLTFGHDRSSLAISNTNHFLLVVFFQSLSAISK